MKFLERQNQGGQRASCLARIRQIIAERDMSGKRGARDKKLNHVQGLPASTGLTQH